MSLVVTPPTDVLLLLLGPEDVMEVERVSQDKVRHFVKNKIRWLALRTSQLAGEESWDTCTGRTLAEGELRGREGRLKLC